MVLTAKTAHVGMFVFDGGRVLKLLKKKELRNARTPSFQYLVSDCKSGHHSTRHWSCDHVLRQIVPTQEQYVVLGLNDLVQMNSKHPERSQLYLSLAKEPDITVRDDIYVKDPGLIQYLQDYYHASLVEPLRLSLNTYVIEPMHRADSALTIQQVTGVEGYDLSHLHDHHHGQHHHPHDSVVQTTWV